MKISRGDKIKIVTDTGRLLEFPIGAFYDYKDRNPTVAVSMSKGWLSEFDVITGDQFIWGQGEQFYCRNMYIEPSQLPIEYKLDKNLEWRIKDPSIDDKYIDSITPIKESIFKKIVNWILG